MSLTMEHILNDAQTLCSRLRDHESIADRLISQTQSLYKQVDAMKQYEEEVGQLNEMAHQKPRDALLQGIQQENRHLRELQQENKELRNSLEEHQNTLEIVMSKYRKQVTQLMEMNRSDRDATPAQLPQSQPEPSSLADQQALKIQEMVGVMRRALELDAESEHRAQEAIAQLSRENKGLRELLRVAYSYNGDLLPPGPAPPAAGSPASPASPASPVSPVSAGAGSPQQSGFQTVRRRVPAAEGAAAGRPPPPSGAPPQPPALTVRPTARVAPVTPPPAAPAPAPTPAPVQTPAPAPAPGATPTSTQAPAPAAAGQSVPASAEASPPTQPAPRPPQTAAEPAARPVPQKPAGEPADAGQPARPA